MFPENRKVPEGRPAGGHSRKNKLLRAKNENQFTLTLSMDIKTLGSESDLR